MPIGEGHGAVRLTDVSGNTAAFDTSGRITIAGGSITASISGDTVIAKISGETISSSISGQVVNASGVWIQASASTAFISAKIVNSGNVNAALIQSWSSDAVNPGTQLGLTTNTMIYANREITNTASRPRLTESGVTAPMSGIGFNLAVNFSGAVATCSGDTYRIENATSGIVQTKMVNSGGSLVTVGSTNTDSNAAGGVNVGTFAQLFGFRDNGSGFSRVRVTESGAAAPMSGIGFNIPVNFSGAYSIQTNNTITAPAWTVITGASGGTNLATQACTSVRLVNLSGNGTMLVGGTGTQAPVSGTKGIPLWQPTANVPYLDFDVTNLNLLSVVAHTSGNSLAIMTFG